MTLRVRIDLTPAVQQHAGIGRYAEELAKALVKLESGDEVCLFYTDPLGRVPAPPLDVLPRKSLRLSNKPWRMGVLLSSYAHVPLDSLVGDVHVFHATDNLLPPLRRVRSVFTLYDLTFLKQAATHLPLNRWFLKLMMPRFLRCADAVICISQHTKRDVGEMYGVDELKVHVVPLGVNPRFRPVPDPTQLAAIRKRYDLPERFILFVGTIEPRKNLVALLEAYRALLGEGRTEKLMVVGKMGWRREATFSRLRELGLEEHVIFPGFVPDGDLPALYSLATCFAFPSLYEGFGLPPLEAMACGCPVVCSNASSLPEVSGDAALLVPPTDKSALAAAIRRLLDDPTLRDDLRARGLRRAAQFTWQETARKTLAIYRSVAGQVPRTPAAAGTPRRGR